HGRSDGLAEIDVLSRNTTWTINRDTALGFNFSPVTYYDGQGFMVRKGLNVKSALELYGAAICVQSGTTTELNLADYFKT
ncbi:transporter substrate-binding domain-containing protein, partial [Rhizobium leguminosarum]